MFSSGWLSQTATCFAAHGASTTSRRHRTALSFGCLWNVRTEVTWGRSCCRCRWNRMKTGSVVMEYQCLRTHRSFKRALAGIHDSISMKRSGGSFDDVFSMLLEAGASDIALQFRKPREEVYLLSTCG